MYIKSYRTTECRSQNSILYKLVFYDIFCDIFQTVQKKKKYIYTYKVSKLILIN